jgi:sugar lactone lactonase YvrE
VLARNNVNEMAEIRLGGLTSVFAEGSGSLFGPNALAYSAMRHTLYVSDVQFNRILGFDTEQCRFTPSAKTYGVVQHNAAGGGITTSAEGQSDGVSVETVGNHVYFLENATNGIGDINLSTGAVTVIDAGLKGPTALAPGPNGRTLYVADLGNIVRLQLPAQT